MHTERKPFAELTKGMAAKTMCEVRELIPNRRIAWRAYMTPKTGLRSKLAFELSPTADGGTLLKQSIDFHLPALLTLVFQLRYGRDVDSKVGIQAEAGLQNIKTILEQANGRPHHNGSSSA